MNGHQKHRLDALLAYVDEKEVATIKELADELNVTEMTVRRDVQILKDNNLVTQLHGAVLKKEKRETLEIDDDTYSILRTLSINQKEKEKIGKAAANLVKANDTIFLDIGTTSAFIAKALPINADITTICFSMNVFEELAKRNIKNIFVTGGFYHRDTEAFESDNALKNLDVIRANIAFIAPSGINMDVGLTAMTPYEVKIKNKMITYSKERVLVADSSKFSEIRPCFVSYFDKITKVITDKDLDKEWQEFFKENQIELILC